MAQILRDPYYLGIVTYKGHTYPGRHQPLVSEALFAKVQEFLAARGVAGERRREHHHYLKGSLFCGRCWREREVLRRMVLQRTVGRHGKEYFYFFCMGIQDKTCDAPHVNIHRVEKAVEDHYQTIRFSPDFLASLRSLMAETVADTDKAAKVRHDQIAKQLTSLDAKEENLLDLAADSALPKTKIQQRIRDIELDRRKLRAELEQSAEDLASGAEHIEECLSFLAELPQLYLAADHHVRREINQAVFTHLFVIDDEVTDYGLGGTFSSLHGAERGWERHQTTQRPSRRPFARHGRPNGSHRAEATHNCPNVCKRKQGRPEGRPCQNLALPARIPAFGR
ncbi:hypothetical protein CATRI_07345 [Corynebacterium atrinae]|nr:recombinase family protein [Corynebacterium atrinae]WJY63550.1 hypothetical protein CATRI_07345 [Corynebacterium atrinae]